MLKIISRFIIVLIFGINIGCSTSFKSHTQINKPKENVINTEKLSITQKLKENGHLSVEKRIALYRQLKNKSPDKYNFENEDELTMYGYSFLWDNKVEESIEIFKLIVEQFLNSSNPYDSLGEAYMVNGNNELAIVNYEKSLELNPDNFNAEDQIERIKYPNRTPETFADKFSKVFTVEEYQEDLNQLANKLIEIHPSALKFISKKGFWELIEKKKSMVTDNITFNEFYWFCSEIIASVNCSHTSMSHSFQEANILPVPLRFPIQTRWINDQLFVTDPTNNEKKVDIKDEIVSINGIVVSELISEIYKHIPSQGYIETSKRHDFNILATGMIPYALNFPETYEIVVKGKENSIVLNANLTFKVQLEDTSIQPCKEQLCFEVLNDSKTAILTISSFNYYPWNNLTFFQDFIDVSFKRINTKGIKNLIIDVRFNGGGSQESSIYLLKYLVDKPFVYSSSKKEIQEPFENVFKGKTYFIIDGNGNSTTGHFMSLVKTFDLGTIVGEELGSNQFCTAGQTICRLSHTKLKYYVANSINESTATSLPDEVGILPDYYVTQSIEEYLNNVDAVKEYTMKLIKKNKIIYN